MTELQQQQQYDHDHYISGEWETTQQYYNTFEQRLTVKKGTPKLLSITPCAGKEGAPLTMVLQDLSPQPVKLAFNSLVVDIKQIQFRQTSTMTTTLIATVPNFQTTLSTVHIVPVSLCFFDSNDIIVDTSFMANFTYQLDDNDTANTTQLDQQSRQNGRKRTYSYLADPCDSPISSKRAYQENTQNRSPYSTSVTSSSTKVPYSSYLHQHRNDQNDNHSMAPQSQPSYSPPLSETLTLSSSSAYSQQQKKSHRRPSLQNLKSTSHQPSTSVAHYQPYPGLVNHCNFDLVTDLGTMMHHWTAAERIQGRRLVRFWREDGPDNLIQCECQPIPQNDAAATDINNTVVSCIYWPETDDYYITSVDAIYLLESLMKIHFGVEEKNRIRRNLEGFRPVTVAKCKPISAEFFKRVMSFPHPKPRNIEKDIKAFTWKILPYALKKIITKYAIASSVIPDQVHRPYSSPLPAPSSSLSTSLQQQQSYQDNEVLTSTFLSPMPFNSSISPDSVAASSSSSSSSPLSPLTTPPSAAEDPHHQHPNQRSHVTNKQQQLYYNPTTMTYGRHQQPGVRPAAQSQDELDLCLLPTSTPNPAPSPPLSSSPTTVLCSEPIFSNVMNPSFLEKAPFCSNHPAMPLPITSNNTCNSLYPFSISTSAMGNLDGIKDPVTFIPGLTSTALPSSNPSFSTKYVPQLFMDGSSPLV